MTLCAYAPSWTLEQNSQPEDDTNANVFDHEHSHYRSDMVDLVQQFSDLDRAFACRLVHRVPMVRPDLPEKTAGRERLVFRGLWVRDTCMDMRVLRVCVCACATTKRVCIHQEAAT
jgi:hypothetical protein